MLRRSMMPRHSAVTVIGRRHDIGNDRGIRGERLHDRDALGKREGTSTLLIGRRERTWRHRTTQTGQENGGGSITEPRSAICPHYPGRRVPPQVACSTLFQPFLTSLGLVHHFAPSFRDAPLGAGPESITTVRGYGFRARA